MNQQLGAHELLECHEVLNATIDGINQFQLYQPHCKDPELLNILQNQINFMISEYNTMVQLLRNKGQQQNIGTYRTIKNVTPSYGVTNAHPETPNTSINEMDDQDVASGMLTASKSSAVLRMHAALECADPQLRSIMIQGARNCADQAYEVWKYMNQRGYYPVPTFQESTAQSIINHYQPIGNQVNNQQ